MVTAAPAILVGLVALGFVLRECTISYGWTVRGTTAFIVIIGALVSVLAWVLR